LGIVAYQTDEFVFKIIVNFDRYELPYSVTSLSCFMISFPDENFFFPVILITGKWPLLVVLVK